MQNNAITILKAGEITTEDILKSYWLEDKKDRKRYLETLIILNNIEKAGKENADDIFNPYVIE